MNYDVIRHSASSLKPRLKFWKYNPNTKTAYFTATTKDGERQYPIGISKLQDMTPGSIKNALTSSLIRFGVTHDDQLIKAVNEILSMSHSATEEEEIDVIDVSEEVLEHHGVKGMRWGVVHEDENAAQRVGSRLSTANANRRRTSQHSGYYSPNLNSRSNTSSGSSSPKDKTGTSYSGSNSRDQRQQRYVFSDSAVLKGSTPVYTLGVNDGKGGGVRVVNFEIPSSAITGVNSWLALGNNAFGYIERTAKENNVYLSKTMTNNIFRSLMWCIADNQDKWDLKNRYSDSRDSWLKDGSGYAYGESRRGDKGHNNGYHISGNAKSVKHALFTEVYDMDDYLEHHGILGMKWGVRRYQNEDGSLTEAGRKHYAKNSHNSPLVPHPTKWSHSHNYKNLREDVKSTDNVIEKKALATSAQVSNMTRTANRNFLTSLAGSSLSAGATATLALLEASEGLILGAAAAPLAVAGAINLGRSIYSIYNSVRIGNIEKRIEWDAEDERILKELEKEQSK